MEIDNSKFLFLHGTSTYSFLPVPGKCNDKSEDEDNDEIYKLNLFVIKVIRIDAGVKDSFYNLVKLIGEMIDDDSSFNYTPFEKYDDCFRIHANLVIERHKIQQLLGKSDSPRYGGFDTSRYMISIKEAMSCCMPRIYIHCINGSRTIDKLKSMKVKWIDSK